MNARKRLFAFLFAALSVLLFTACGKWDYSREAVKAANEAQGDTLRVEFKVNQTFTSALRAAVEDNIQPNDVDKAMTMDKSIEKLLTSGYRLDVYALRADTGADQAAAQLADEFVNRLSGCEDEGYISMVKAENGYFYMAVLTYKHGGSGSGSGGGDDGGSEEPEKPETMTFPVQWDAATKTLTFQRGTNGMNAAFAMGNNSTIETEEGVKKGLKVQAEWLQTHDPSNYFDPDNFNFQKIEHLIIKEDSGIDKIADADPSVIDGSDSLILQSYLFMGTLLKSVELDGVGYVGESAFSLNPFLEEINISGVDNIKIAEHAFVSSSSYAQKAKVIISSDHDLTIDDSAFDNCGSLVEVSLSASKISIGENVFYKCLSLKVVTLTGTVTNVGECAFGEYKGGTLNDDVTIHYAGGADAFAEKCPDKSLEKVGLSEKNFAQD